MESIFRMNQDGDYKQPRPLYRLLLQAQQDVDAERALRSLLKIALRRLRLRCISIEKVADDGPRRI
jgi:hypothetical protein